MSAQDERFMSVAYAAWKLRYEELALDLSEKSDHPVFLPMLCDLLDRSTNEVIRVRAAEHLGKRWIAETSAYDSLFGQLRSPSGHIRLAVLRALWKSPRPNLRRDLQHILAFDPVPLIRRIACRMLARLGDWESVVALGLEDPVWRVRWEAAKKLIGSDFTRKQLDNLLEKTRNHPRAIRAKQFILAVLDGERSLPSPPPVSAWEQKTWWNDDPAALLENLRHLSPELTRRELFDLLDLATLQDGFPVESALEEIRAFLHYSLLKYGDKESWTKALSFLDQPRIPSLQLWAQEAAHLCPEELGIAERFIQSGNNSGALIWALSQSSDDPDSVVNLLQHQDSRVRKNALEWLLRHHDLHLLNPDIFLAVLSDDEPEVVDTAICALSRNLPFDEIRANLPENLSEFTGIYGCLVHLNTQLLSSEPDDFWRDLSERGTLKSRIQAAAIVRDGKATNLKKVLGLFQADPDHRVRAAALTKDVALRIWHERNGEVSWRVLDRAAELLDRSLSELVAEPLSELEPLEPAQPTWERRSYFSPLLISNDLTRGNIRLPEEQRPPGARSLSSGQLITPLVISGRYGLSGQGLERAIESGINSFFWEPTYGRMTSFLKSLAPSTRKQLVIMGGSFVHDGRAVIRELDAMLQTLGIERVEVFFLFWVRSRVRLHDEVAEALMDAQKAGKLGSFGLSTHQRDLAAEAIREGWENIMIRHNAAHTGAEQEIFPLALEHHAQVFTFSNLLYTLMLKPRDGRVLRAEDCYRYSLSQPGVTASLSAPRTLKELEQNLKVLERSSLTREEQQSMREFARPIQRETHRMMRLIRAD